MEYIGVDGCKAGWIAVSIKKNGEWRITLHRDIHELHEALSGNALILIDIPIGLPTDAPRRCDSEARNLLKPTRSSSVFPVPCRQAVYAHSYREACDINQEYLGKKLTKQTWNICPKIREVDQFLQQEKQVKQYIHEAHPEIAFWSLNNAQPMQYPKRTEKGAAERKQVLNHYFKHTDAIIEHALERYYRRDLKHDDIADALALAVSIWRAAGEIHFLPDNFNRDETGLPMSIAYC